MGGEESLKALLFAGTGCSVGVVAFAVAGAEGCVEVCVGSKGGASSSIIMRSLCPLAQETTDRKRGALYFEV